MMKPLEIKLLLSVLMNFMWCTLMMTDQLLFINHINANKLWGHGDFSLILQILLFIAITKIREYNNYNIYALI